MSSGAGPRIPEVNPSEAWEILKTNPAAQLVDVRTRAEWGFVGLPDLSDAGKSPVLIEWATFPTMAANQSFLEEVQNGFEGTPSGTVLFICRSGVRSMRAAELVSSHYAAQGVDLDCRNVAEGFEGDLDPARHRGGLNGWKARGLPWHQS